MTIITGLGLLLLTLAAFSLFSMKAPKGSAAMSGMANAAVATFLVEAVHRYISGDLLHLAFLGETGTISGNMGGVAAAIMVPIGMGVNPVFAVVAGVALGGYGILPGFIAGYAIGFIAPFIEKHLPPGLDSVLGALMIAPIARFIAFLVDPAVNAALAHIAHSHGTSAGRGYQDDLYVSPQFHGSYRHAGTYRTAHGYCSYCLLRRFLYQWCHL